jgi:hypothetical protein
VLRAMRGGASARGYPAGSWQDSSVGRNLAPPRQGSFHQISAEAFAEGAVFVAANWAVWPAHGRAHSKPMEPEQPTAGAGGGGHARAGMCIPVPCYTRNTRGLPGLDAWDFRRDAYPH